MAEIQKISLLYMPVEDRLAFDVQDAEGAGPRPWLTQKLRRALVAALVPLLGKVATLHLPPEARGTAQSWITDPALEAAGGTVN